MHCFSPYLSAGQPVVDRWVVAADPLPVERAYHEVPISGHVSRVWLGLGVGEDVGPSVGTDHRCGRSTWADPTVAGAQDGILVNSSKVPGEWVVGYGGADSVCALPG